LVPGAGAPAKPSGTLYAYSARVVPVPDDWGSDVCVTGYWFLDSGDWRPDAALSAFLSSGDPPVYVGFGSMPGLEPEKLAALVVDARAQARQRGKLATGGGAQKRERQPPHLHAITAAPHDKLLPHVCASGQHGGAGTTAASLRAGKPTAICPFFGDQPFWARRVTALGVGPKALDRKTLTAETLAAAITAMADPAMQDRAARLGALLRTEDGVGAAVDFVESRASAPTLAGSRAE
jgi:UDP:flavonoid glycosyltransferase YjiC (YdhE family)